MIYCVISYSLPFNKVVVTEKQTKRCFKQKNKESLIWCTCVLSHKDKSMAL